MRLFLSITISVMLLLFSSNSFASDLKPKPKQLQQDSIITDAVIDVEYNTTGNVNIDWKSELTQARITHTLDNKGIRITLPNADPAKVIIANKKGTKVLKTISYVSPAVIDISKLRKGHYQLIMEMHGVVEVKTFEKKGKWNCSKKSSN